MNPFEAASSADLREIRVNGKRFLTETDRSRRLSDVLREELDCRDVKIGCDAGDCGACTVLLDGAPVCACLTPVSQVGARQVTTLSGLPPEILDRLQSAFHSHGAAQCGICTPGLLVTAAALLAARLRPTRREVEAALGGVLCRCTGYRKIVDAVCDAARGQIARVEILPQAGEAVGAPVPRLDGEAKLNGRELFGADQWPLGALWVRAIRSPHHHADFTFGDIDGWARATPGVEAVLTARDIPGTNRFGVIPPLADQPALAESHVRFRGEAIAVIAGPREALEAADLTGFPVSWTLRPALLEPAEALAQDAPCLHEDRPGNILTRGRVVSGNAEKALVDAFHTVEAVVETSFVEHAYIEPEAGSAWYQDGILTVMASTQAPHMDREDLARLFALPLDRVRVIPTAAGGGFGSKLDLSLQPLIALAAMHTGKPCRMVYGRGESMRSTTKRHPGKMSARIGADAEGRLTGMIFTGDFNTGPYASWGPTVATRVPVHASGPYLMPNYRAETRAVHTNAPIAGAFRGFGVPQAAILQETLFDRLAEKCGLDRLEFRRINALRDGDSTVCGQRLASAGISACLDALEPVWREALIRAEIANREPGPVRHGVGIASCWYGCGNTSLPNPSTIRIGLTPDGRIKLHQGATDIGQGSNTVIAQICADALGMPLSMIDLIGPDTALTPDCGKTSASRQTFVTGRAAERAGRAMRRALCALAGMEDCAEIQIRGGELVVYAGGRLSELDLGSLAPDHLGYVVTVEESYDPPTTTLDADGQGTPYALYGYGAQIAELAVDCELGTVRLSHVTAAHDLGRVINPVLAEGQIQGGIAQGIGLALMEEYVPGRTENLHDYLIPTFGDVPEITSILVECPDPEGPMGARGLGEHVLIPTAPTIFNAIRHATGAEITRAPALPHRVLASIRKSRA